MDFHLLCFTVNYIYNSLCCSCLIRPLIQQSLLLKKLMVSSDATERLQISPAFTPQVFRFTDATH